MITHKEKKKGEEVNKSDRKAQFSSIPDLKALGQRPSTGSNTEIYSHPNKLRQTI